MVGIILLKLLPAALALIHGTPYVRSRTMRVDPNLFVSELRMAHHTVDVLPNHQVCRLQLIVLKLRVQFLDLRKVILDARVFLHYQLIDEDLAQKTQSSHSRQT